MRVKIGPYRNRWISNIHTNYMHWKYGRFDWDDNNNKFESLLENLEDGLQWLYNRTINKILDNYADQKIRVKIDRWDTWSMDHTLSHVVVPMLKQLAGSKHGSPFVDDEDVPEELKSTSAPSKKDEYDLDDNHHKRWEWVIGEMIWAFEQKTRDDWESDYYKYESDPKERFGLKLVWEDREARKAHQERMTNGFKLFGKYYESLWD